MEHGSSVGDQASYSYANARIKRCLRYSRVTVVEACESSPPGHKLCSSL